MKLYVLFDWYEDQTFKQTAGEKTGETPCIRASDTTVHRDRRTAQTVQNVVHWQKQMSCRRGSALSHIMGRELAEGRQVHLDGIQLTPIPARQPRNL